jgi:hypothetical protein
LPSVSDTCGRAAPSPRPRALRYSGEPLDRHPIVVGKLRACVCERAAEPEPLALRTAAGGGPATRSPAWGPSSWPLFPIGGPARPLAGPAQIGPRGRADGSGGGDAANRDDNNGAPATTTTTTATLARLNVNNSIGPARECPRRVCRKTAPRSGAPLRPARHANVSVALGTKKGAPRLARGRLPVLYGSLAAAAAAGTQTARTEFQLGPLGLCARLLRGSASRMDCC